MRVLYYGLRESSRTFTGDKNAYLQRGKRRAMQLTLGRRAAPAWLRCVMDFCGADLEDGVEGICFDRVLPRRLWKD
ncbi:hypothetical protein F506_19795 [Herbaspirillum hiltneri N3]|uniref:Transposase n=2 Tax=Herbaspirillum TaxID=963 RepID=A0ABM5V522_9BURK|nr:hypothetical protein F506_19795 [Herbaspirillum hiltneri N3]